VALIKPLKLRSEKIAAKPVRAKDRPCVSVIVDTKIFHLDQPYSYIVPESLSGIIEVGSLVRVPFGRTTTEGIVLERSESNSLSGLKFVDAAISTTPVATSRQLALFQAVSSRYGSSLWDVVRLALPSFSATGEKKFRPFPLADYLPDSTSTTRQAVTIHREKEIFEYLDQARKQNANRKILVIAPDQKTLESLSKQADVVLSGLDSKSDRFLNYLRANLLQSGVVIGLRSSIFIDLRPQDLLVVIADSDINHYEQHSPTYNSRDIALLRANSNSVAFVGFSHSLEIVRLIEKGYLIHVSSGPIGRKVFTESPDREHGFISEGLKRGSILIVHANAGYVKSFACNKCRNIAVCECGSRLVLARNAKAAECTNCGWKCDSWNCSYCTSNVPRVLGRGVERRAEDYGRTFPRVRIIHSSGENPVSVLPKEKCIVVATPGMEPSGEYAAVLLLDGDQIFGRVSLRGDEQGEMWWSRAASLVAQNGVLYISLPSGHPISQSMLRGSFTKAHSDSIAQRSSAQLPPDFRLVSIEGLVQELINVRNLFESFSFEKPLSILGPVEGKNVRLIVKYPVELGNAVTAKTYEMNRVRSLQGLKTLRVAVDPFDFI
jgi:primosomal protein N' (replication factor Y)